MSINRLRSVDLRNSSILQPTFNAHILITAKYSFQRMFYQLKNQIALSLKCLNIKSTKFNEDPLNLTNLIPLALDE